MIEYLLIADCYQLKILELNFPKSRNPLNSYTAEELIEICVKNCFVKFSRFAQKINDKNILYGYRDCFDNYLILVIEIEKKDEIDIFELFIQIEDILETIDHENSVEIEKNIPKFDKIILTHNIMLNTPDILRGFIKKNEEFMSQQGGTDLLSKIDLRKRFRTLVNIPNLDHLKKENNETKIENEIKENENVTKNEKEEEVVENKLTLKINKRNVNTENTTDWVVENEIEKSTNKSGWIVENEDKSEIKENLKIKKSSKIENSKIIENDENTKIVEKKNLFITKKMEKSNIINDENFTEIEKMKKLEIQNKENLKKSEIKVFTIVGRNEINEDFQDIESPLNFSMSDHDQSVSFDKNKNSKKKIIYLGMGIFSFVVIAASGAYISSS